MSLFSRFTKQATDPLEPQARKLVQACAILAIDAYKMLDTDMIDKKLSFDQIDFFATCGAVRSGMSYLMNTVSKERFRKL